MPIIKPVSELRNYGEVLKDVAVGQPVFLTKNGTGKYVILEISEFEKVEKQLAENWLFSELEKGRLSGEKDGWIPGDEVFRKIEERFNFSSD